MTARRDLRIFLYQLSFADPFPFETQSAVLAAASLEGFTRRAASAPLNA